MSRCQKDHGCCAVSWSRARNSQEHKLCLSLQVWAPEVPPTPLVINEIMRHSQCTLLPSTRPGTSFTDTRTHTHPLLSSMLVHSCVSGEDLKQCRHGNAHEHKAIIPSLTLHWNNGITPIGLGSCIETSSSTNQ